MSLDDLMKILGKNFRETLKEIFQRGEAYAKWCSENHDRLRQEYPDMWIAIYDQKVVAHNKDLKELCGQLDDSYRGRVIIERTYFKEPKPQFILSSIA